MMAKTHMLFALTVTSFTLETTQPLVLGAAVIASQLPDVDTSTSLAGRLLLPLSRWLEYRFAHRTVTHSFLATLGIALLTVPLRGQNTLLWHAVILGYFSGWFGDVFTKSGVAAFYPLSPARLVIPANPRLRLTTGTRAEYVVGSGLLVSFLLSLHLNTNGGLLRGFNTWLAQPEGVVTLFARASATHQILVHIEGRLVSSSSPVSAEFGVIEVEGEKLLVRDSKGTLYWAGHAQSCSSCHLDMQRVQARLGAPIVIETREWQWQEEEVGEVVSRQLSVLSRLPFPPPPSSARTHEPAGNATDNRQLTTNIRLSGELTLRDAEGLRVPSSLQQFNPVEVVGNPDEWARLRTVRLRAATLADLAPLQSYFGSGHLVVRIIRGGSQ
jgi:inner membrane protein